MHIDLDDRAGVKIVVLAFSLAVIGCAAHSNVVPSPDGTLTAMRRANSLHDSTAVLRVQALKDADEYCVVRGKKPNVIRSREIPAVGHWPAAEISFTCE